MYNKKFIPVANPYINKKEINAVNKVIQKKMDYYGEKS